MILSQKGEDFIKDFEQLRLEAYKPHPRDEWTIGWGHTGDVRPQDKISLDFAEYLFDRDVEWAVAYVNDRIKGVKTTQGQFDAMVSLTFNIGKGGFRTSTVLRLHRLNMDFGACAAFLMWHWSRGQRMRGLLRRRCLEAALYCDDNWGETDD